MTKHLLIATLTLAAFWTGGCVTQPPAQPQITTSLPAQSFRREWSADLKLESRDKVERMWVVDDLVLVYTKMNHAYAIRRDSGRIKMHTVIPASPVKPHPPVVLKERIIIPTASTLEIYSRGDGHFERSYSTKSSLRTDAVGQVNGSRVFFGVDSTLGGRVAAIETMPGQYNFVNQKWELMADHADQIESTPAAAEGSVFMGFMDGQIYAVNAESRAPIWATSSGLTFKTQGAILADIKADESGVYVCSMDTKMYCVDKSQGKIKWTFFAGIPLREAPELTSSMVYLSIPGRGILAIDKLSGPPVREPRWVVRDVVKLVAEDEKHAYFQRTDNVVIALDKTTGEQKFTSKRRDLVMFGTNRAKDGRIYAATEDGQIIEIAPILKAGQAGEIAELLERYGADVVAGR